MGCIWNIRQPITTLRSVLWSILIRRFSTEWGGCGWKIQNGSGIRWKGPCGYITTQLNRWNLGPLNNCGKEPHWYGKHWLHSNDISMLRRIRRPEENKWNEKIKRVIKCGCGIRKQSHLQTRALVERTRNFTKECFTVSSEGQGTQREGGVPTLQHVATL